MISEEDYQEIRKRLWIEMMNESVLSIWPQGIPSNDTAKFPAVHGEHIKEKING